jgi:hypothetical protein
MVCVIHAGVSPGCQTAQASASAQDGLTPAESGPAADAIPLNPLQKGVSQASSIVVPATLDYPAPGFKTLTGALLGLDTRAPPLGKPVSGAGDNVDPVVSLEQHPETLEDMLMGPGAKALDSALVGAWKQLSENGKHTLLTKEAGSNDSAALTAPYHREDDVPQGNANLASIRVWSKAVIYTSASQGIMCQGSTLTIVTSSGETPSCLDLFSIDKRDGAQVWHAC